MTLKATERSRFESNEDSDASLEFASILDGTLSRSSRKSRRKDDAEAEVKAEVETEAEPEVEAEVEARNREEPSTSAAKMKNLRVELERVDLAMLAATANRPKPTPLVATLGSHKENAGRQEEVVASEENEGGPKVKRSYKKTEEAMRKKKGKR